MTLLKVDLSAAIDKLKKENSKKIILQVPEGLKVKALELSRELEKKANVEVIIFTDPCFGACDLPLHERELFKADYIVHIGHNEFMLAPKTIYIPAYYKIEDNLIDKSVENILKKLNEMKLKKIILLTTVNFYESMEKVKEKLEKKGIECITDSGLRTKNAQMLGCDSSAGLKHEKEADGFVFLGDGYFHPIAVAITSKKPLLLANLLEGNISEFSEKEKDKYIRSRMVAISQAKDANTFGILITTKIGQMRLGEAQKMKKIIEESGKKAYLLAGDLLLESNLLGLNVDCFVSTGCPRIAVDDGKNWKTPIVNPQELLVALGKSEMDDLKLVGSF